MEELKEGWRLENLEENLEVILDYRGKTPQKSEKGRVTLSAKSVKMGYIDYSNIYYVSEETYSKFMTRGFPKKGDILLTTEAPLGCVAELKDDSVCLAQRLITLRGKKEKLNNKYLLYYLQSPRGQYELLSKATGTTVQGIKRTEFSKVKILMPSLEKQNKIVSILSSIDEKIELNRKINQNLEETAQTLFKRWFIDFEFPNEEGKPYKSSGGKLIESELGEIPEGWEVDELGNNSFLTAGGDKPNLTSKNKNEKYCIPIYSNGTDKKGLYGYTITSKINEEGITISSRGTVGYVCLRTKPYYPIVRLISIVIKNKIISNKFLYFFIKKLNIMGTGTTQQQLTIPNFKKTRILIPDISLQKRFEKLIKKSWDKIEMTEEEIEKLIELRDYLLPRLMSGEVNVSNLKISGISNSD